jgi:hypothetical protein
VNQDADVSRVDVRDRRGQEHEQQDERGGREHEPPDLRAKAGPTIATHAAHGPEAIAD